MTITGRFEPAPERGELATYRFYLDGHRRVLQAKCAGLSPEQLATTALAPSELSLLGLVRHMGRVEHVWFRMVIDGHVDEPMLDADDPTGGFRSIAPTAESVDEAFARWRAQIAYAERCLDALGEEEMGATRRTRHGEETTVRDVLVHMVEEYARHAGHADLLREQIDGTTGR
ncbi:DinB family protein [Nocardioides nematodiphilus]|uniref:DinB family protein n=1 Tax=Nocardioides nematodiphilus TaxID=2849669 RepID=UPI001CDA0ABD|nr:DinB family protein [Nocardioides nematodiphilus]MCA1982859.1 DinB family protein [Nocardioides nematodiphilus]